MDDLVHAMVSLLHMPTCVFVAWYFFSYGRDAKGGGRVNSCVGKDSCSSQTTKEGSESTLLVATLRSSFRP